MNSEYHLKNSNPPIILLRGDKGEPEPVTKVGIIPFFPHAETARWQFLLMKPHAELGHPGSAPEYQMAKGTRRINMGDGWCDMRDDDLLNADPVFYENLIDTALREGKEEIGLKRGNIEALYDMGGFTIVSARKGLRKAIHVFAAQIRDIKNFGSYESKTAEVTWMGLDKFTREGRPDHVKILQPVAERLIAAFFAGK